MADGEPRSNEPSLELPKLGWRRRRKTDPPAESVPVDEVVAEAPPESPVPPAPVAPAAPVVVAPAAPPPRAPELLEVSDDYDTVVDDAPAPAPRARPIKIRVRRPGGMLAAVITGLFVGLGIVGLTWASLQGCESVQGTSSCGKTGYPLLIVILVAMVVVGTLLLRLARVGDPGSTSFLAVGLASVIALLFLINSLESHWMIVVIPVITAACYALAHWVTRTFIEPAAR